MSEISIILVLISTIFHAIWNYIIKRSDHSEIVTFLLSFLGGIFVLPFAIYFLIHNPIPPIGWLYILLTIIIHSFYFITLSRVYLFNELSTGYPIARGTAIGLVPLLAIFIINESINLFSGIAILFIFLGVLSVGFGGINIKNINKAFSLKGFAYAIATGFFIALYSINDKKAMEYVHPVVFLFFVLSPSSISIYLINMKNTSIKNIADVFKREHSSVIIGAMSTLGAYLLVLFALQTTQVSYVSPLREIGIVMGAIFGYIFLKEKIYKVKILGILCIIIGAFMISVFS